jgi:hypothetical protein
MTSQLLLERIVKPVGPVLDWRTHVSGCTEARAQAVGVAPEEARLAVAKLVGPHTVIVGHAVRMVHEKPLIIWSDILRTTPAHSTFSVFIPVSIHLHERRKYRRPLPF